MWYLKELQVSKRLKINNRYTITNNAASRTYELLNSISSFLSSLAPTFGGQDIDPAVSIPAASSRISKRRAADIEQGLGLGRSQVGIYFN